MATENLFEKLQKDAQSEKSLGEMKSKLEDVRRSNQEYLTEYKKGTEKVLDGGQREAQEIRAIERSLQQGKEFVSYVGQTVDGLTSEFGAVDEYLGGVTQYQMGLEWLASKVPLRYFKKQAVNMRTERILKTSLAENITMILEYYKKMKDVMYQSAVENQKAVNEIREVRQNTVSKLNEKEKLYNAAQQDRKKYESSLEAIDGEIATLTGIQRTEKEQERLDVRDRLNDAKNREDLNFSVVKNANNDLKYQEQNLKNYEDVVRALTVAITDMEEKIDNRTVLFEKIETLVKTSYRVKSASQADAAMNKTLAEVTRTAAVQTEGILEELGMRAKAKVMSPEELQGWIARSRDARKRYEADLTIGKDEYAKPGN